MANPQCKPIPMLFPMGGINEGLPYSSIKGGPICVRAADVLNVRPYDPIEERERGGSRRGISKSFQDQVNGSNDIQLLATQVEAVALSEEAGFTNKFADISSSAPANAIDALTWHPDGDVIVVSERTASNQQTLKAYNWSETLGFGTLIDASEAINVGTNGRMRSIFFNPAGNQLICNGNTGPLAIYEFSKTTGFNDTQATVPATTGITDSNGWHTMNWHPLGDRVVISYAAVTTSFASVRVYAWTGTAIGSLLHTCTSSLRSNDKGVGNLAPMGVVVRPDGLAILVNLNDATPANRGLAIWPYDPVSGPGTPQSVLNITLPRAYIFFAPDGAGMFYLNGTSVIFRTVDPATGFGAAVSVSPAEGTGGRMSVRPQGDYVAFSSESGATEGTSAYPFTGAWGAQLNTIDDGDGAPEDPTPIMFHPNGRAIAIGGSTSPYVAAFEFQPATVNPSARRRRLLAVSGGNVYRSNLDMDAMPLVNSGSGALIAAGVVRGAEAFQKFYFCDSTADGYVYFDYADSTVKDWESNLVAGSLPVGSADPSTACRLMTLYRGRIVMSGLLEEPQNWFMSRSGNPRDWDYTPAVTDPGQPIAGNNSNAGEIGDVVVALMPHEDDLLFFGCDHSLWLMRGDPAGGGNLDNVSWETGVVAPDAFCWDLEKNLYFMGQVGVYILQPGGMPQLLSKGKMERIFKQINPATSRVMMLYDRDWQGIHVFISPYAEPGAAPDHYYWDQQTNSWWRDQFPVAVGPTAVHLFNADDPAERAVLLGGYDGYIRRLDDTATGDDGTAITSYVKMPLLHPAMPQGQFQMDEFQVTMAQGAATIEIDILRGSTPEAAAKATAAALTRSLRAGYNPPVPYKLRANTLVFQLRHATLGERWAYETGMAMIRGVGRLRKVE